MANPKKVVIVTGSLEGLTDSQVQRLVAKANASGEGHVRAPKPLGFHFAPCVVLGEGCPGTVHGIFVGNSGVMASNRGVNIYSVEEAEFLLGIAERRGLISAYERGELLLEAAAAGVPQTI